MAKAKSMACTYFGSVLGEQEFRKTTDVNENSATRASTFACACPRSILAHAERKYVSWSSDSGPLP